MMSSLTTDACLHGGVLVGFSCGCNRLLSWKHFGTDSEHQGVGRSEHEDCVAQVVPIAPCREES